MLPPVLQHISTPGFAFLFSCFAVLFFFFFIPFPSQFVLPPCPAALVLSRLSVKDLGRILLSAKRDGKMQMHGPGSNAGRSWEVLNACKSH